MMKIIQFEDTAAKRSSVKTVLRRFGVRDSAWAQSVEEGLQMMEEAASEGHPYDVIISDMYYPITKYGPEAQAGKELIRLLQEKGIDTPVIVLSSTRFHIENSYRTLWYDERSDWERELTQVLKEIAGSGRTV